MKPDEFWNLTFFEISDMLEAFVKEEERQDDILNQRLSWQTSHLMNATGNFKKKVKPTDLYQPKFLQEQEVNQEIVERFDSQKDKELYLENLMKKFKKEVNNSDGSQ